MDYINFANYFGVIRRRSQALIVEACSEYKLNYSEFALLLKLDHMEGCSQDDMVAALLVDKAAITRIIKTLEGKGYIYRKQDEDDHRVKRLYLTDAGKELHPKIKNIINKLMMFLADKMSKEQGEIAMEGICIAASALGSADYETVFGVKKSGK